MRLIPVPYRLFINALALLEAYISPPPAEAGSPFMIYAWKGSGYIPQPHGPSCPVIHRDMDELVTTGEIRSVLRKLEIKPEAFLQTITEMRSHFPSGDAATAEP